MLVLPLLLVPYGVFLALGVGTSSNGYYPSNLTGFWYPNSGNAGVFNLAANGNNYGSTNYTYVPTIYEIGFSNSYTIF